METPEFSNRDPLTPEFWDQRFAQNFKPWDKGSIPAQIQSFVATHQAMPSFIPGCGNAHEVTLFAHAGWPVMAIDFSPEAVQQARQQIHPALASQIMCADFFSFTPPFQPKCIYERAFLCAMPPSYWPKIAARWAELLPSQGLLAGYFFIDPDFVPQAKPKGPPFCASAQQIIDLLSENFVCLQDEAVTDSIAVFTGKERWQVWQRR